MLTDLEDLPGVQLCLCADHTDAKRVSGLEYVRGPHVKLFCQVDDSDSIVLHPSIVRFGADNPGPSTDSLFKENCEFILIGH